MICFQLLALDLRKPERSASSGAVARGEMIVTPSSDERTSAPFRRGAELSPLRCTIACSPVELAGPISVTTDLVAVCDDLLNESSETL